MLSPPCACLCQTTLPVRMDIFLQCSQSQRCGRTPVCLLGLLTAGQTSHHTHPEPAVTRLNMCPCVSSFLLQ